LHRQPENADLLTAWLVQHGAELELLGLYNTRLRRAAAEGDTAELAQLLACGAEVDSVGPDGSTALQLAAEWQQLDAVEILIEAGADVDACDDNGLTPLLLAASSHENGDAARAVEVRP
jgi:ankyrin repeat protein